nr:VanZ family protein [Desulfobulbus alkaliphilus]
MLIGTPFFFIGGPGYYSSRSFQAAWNLGHVLFFFLFSLWLFEQLRGRKYVWSRAKSFVYVFVVVFLVGLLVEYLQLLVNGRAPDPFDLLRNQLGCLLAFALVTRPPLFSRHRWQVLFRGVVLVLLAITLWPLTKAVFDERLAVAQFPVLSDFETPFERFRWMDPRQLREEKEQVRHGRKSVRVQLSTAKYSGVSLFHFPGDWRGYQTLHFSVYNPLTENLELHCRVHDLLHRTSGAGFHDRFNQRFSLAPGWNDLVVSLEAVKNAPRERSMDMSRIHGFGLFVVQQPDPLALYLDHVYLSR